MTFIKFLASCSLFFALSIQAQAFVNIHSFVQGMKDYQAPVQYVEQSLNVLSAIRFGDLPSNAEAAYNRMSNEITLNRDLQDPRTGYLKPIEQLSNDQIGTLYHELWHCFHTRLLHSQLPDLFSFWKSQAQALYSDHQESYHDEAYAAFITEVISRYVNIRRSFESKTPEIRKRMRANPTLAALYENAFHERYFGYYRNFWGEFVQSTVNLPEEDRKRILLNLFNDELPPRYIDAFAEKKFQKR